MHGDLYEETGNTPEKNLKDRCGEAQPKKKKPKGSKIPTSSHLAITIHTNALAN